MTGPALSRRALLRAVAAAAVALPVVAPDSAYAGASVQRDTFEAWADTFVPGERRFAGDRVVAGAAAGPGAVQAGAYTLFLDPDVGLAPLLPALATLINTEATAYALGHGKVLDLRQPPFVALDFAGRTAVADRLLRGSGPVQLIWYAMAAMPMLAFHTAAHLDTADAVRQGHPGLAWLRFPPPDPDGFWRFPDFSYRLPLAEVHPATAATGHPA